MIMKEIIKMRFYNLESAYVFLILILILILIPDQSIDKLCCRSGIRACLKIEEMTDF